MTAHALDLAVWCFRHGWRDRGDRYVPLPGLRALLCRWTSAAIVAWVLEVRR